MCEGNKVAVIMSLYKNDRLVYVKSAVDSILNQTYKRIDLYIQFDGPIDNCIQKYLFGLNDSRVIIKTRGENKGLAVSLNELLGVVKEKDYDFIARMDADDISRLIRIEKQVVFLESNPDVDMVGSAINEIDENGYDRGKVIRYPCKPSDCYSFFAKRNPVAHPSVMFRRSFLDKVGWAYPTDYIRNEDTRMWYEGYKHGCIVANLPDVLLDYRMTDDMFKQRRNGREFAKSQLLLRKMIATELGYGMKAYVYAYCMYLLMVSPSWIRKIAYKLLR